MCDVIVRKESKVVKNAFEIDKQMYAISIHSELNGNFHFIFYKSTKTSEESNTINLLGTTFPNLPIIQFELEMNLDRTLQFKAISSNSEKIIPLFDVKKGIENSAYFLDKIDETDRQSFFDSCEKALLNDQIWQNEFKFIAEGGCVFHFSINAKFYISDAGTFQWYGFLENITSKKDFEHEKSALIYHTLDYERGFFMFLSTEIVRGTNLTEISLTSNLLLLTMMRMLRLNGMPLCPGCGCWCADLRRFVRPIFCSSCWNFACNKTICCPKS